MFGMRDLQVILKLTAPDSKNIQVEAFQDQETNDVGIWAKLGFLGILIMMVVAFLASFGAARLSWCYNMYVGNSTSISIFYALLAFWFSGFYYPFYAWFLNPICDMKMAGVAATMGGRRR